MENKCSQPLVSVIMGLYNAERTMDISIESIINQTYENWEFIICDDCSNDDTYAKLLGYQQKHPNKFTILKNDSNLRLAASLNSCLEVAKGEYVARMDGDDISLPHRFETQVNFLQENLEYAVVGSSVILFGDEGERGMRGRSGEVNKTSMLTGVPFAHPTIMVRKECYDELGGYTVSSITSRCEDLDLWFRFFACDFHGYNIGDPLLKYYENLCINGKKSFKKSIEYFRVRIHGYKLLKFPKYKYIFAIKPIVSAILPQRLIYLYHNKSGKTANLKKKI